MTSAPKASSARRDALLRAAERVFADKGFHAASIAEVAEAAGMTQGNLYHYFRSKDELILAIAEQEWRIVRDVLGIFSAEEDFFGALDRLVDQEVGAMSAEHVRLTLEIVAETSRNPRLAELSRQIEAEARVGLEAALARAVARGQVDADLDVRMAANLLLTLGDGLYWREATDPTFDAARLAPALKDMLRRYLTPRGAKR
jgi:TetR/AcrR family transcriptional regulator, repressor for uid operon